MFEKTALDVRGCRNGQEGSRRRLQEDPRIQDAGKVDRRGRWRGTCSGVGFLGQENLRGVGVREERKG